MAGTEDDDDRILGTVVPDTPIHRASMWLEELRFGERRREADMEEDSAEGFRRFIEATGLPVTVEQLDEAVVYYATNHKQMFFGNMKVATNTKVGFLSMEAVLQSVWLDGFQHGVVTAQGKRGLSTAESELGREI
jgi:hypothetical protein